jgi:cytoskeletal protein CcmA (bactofilin family)
VWNRAQQADQPDAPPPKAAAPDPGFRMPEASTGRAVLGPSIVIRGDLSGEEDLVIEGQVEGQVTFKNNTVTIGSSGRVQADVSCKTIIVDGQVQGNLYGEELVVIRKSSHVQGNAVASRVHLEDGAIFRGSIDMQPKQEPPTKSAEIARKVREANAPSETERSTPARSGPDLSVNRQSAVPGRTGGR